MGNLAIDESLLHGLLAQRATARQQRDYATSDQLRDELRSYGVKRETIRMSFIIRFL
jgi:cysteinyl-tRNA synthetase